MTKRQEERTKRRKSSALTPEELAEISASTRRLDAEARQADAEAALAVVEAQKAAVELRAYSSSVEVSEMVAKERRIEHESNLAGNEHHQVYPFVYPVCAASVHDCMEDLNRWHRTKPGCNMEIVFTSPGGTVVEGMALFDYIQFLKRQDHKIVTKTYGMAASMAGILLQAGTERVAGKEAWVLIHEGSFGAMGDVGKVLDTVDWVKRISKRIIDIFAVRAAEKTGKTPDTVAAFIRKNWNRKDWWLSSDELLKHGFIDRVE